MWLLNDRRFKNWGWKDIFTDRKAKKKNHLKNVHTLATIIITIIIINNRKNNITLVTWQQLRKKLKGKNIGPSLCVKYKVCLSYIINGWEVTKKFTWSWRIRKLFLDIVYDLPDKPTIIPFNILYKYKYTSYDGPISMHYILYRPQPLSSQQTLYCFSIICGYYFHCEYLNISKFISLSINL